MHYYTHGYTASVLSNAQNVQKVVDGVSHPRLTVVLTHGNDTLMEERHMPTLTAGTGSAQIEDGVYDATLLNIEEQEPQAPTTRIPDPKPWLKWFFHVYDSEEGQELTAVSSMNFSPKAKPRKWVEAILARKLTPGEEIDTETLCPHECQVVIKNDPDTGFARIEDVMGQRRRPVPKRKIPDETPPTAPTTEGVLV